MPFVFVGNLYMTLELVFNQLWVSRKSSILFHLIRSYHWGIAEAQRQQKNPSLRILCLGDSHLNKGREGVRQLSLTGPKAYVSAAKVMVRLEGVHPKAPLSGGCTPPGWRESTQRLLWVGAVVREGIDFQGNDWWHWGIKVLYSLITCFPLSAPHSICFLTLTLPAVYSCSHFLIHS